MLQIEDISRSEMVVAWVLARLDSDTPSGLDLDPDPHAWYAEIAVHLSSIEFTPSRGEIADCLTALCAFCGADYGSDWLEASVDGLLSPDQQIQDWVP